MAVCGRGCWRSEAATEAATGAAPALTQSGNAAPDIGSYPPVGEFGVRSADAERVRRRMICGWPPPTNEVLGTSRVSLVSVLLFAPILAADGEEIGVGAGALY